MSKRGPELIDTFNQSDMAKESGVVLMPEFGGWMVEAVPTEPYMSIIDADILLSCEQKLIYRRKVLESFFKPYGIHILSLTNAISLG